MNILFVGPYRQHDEWGCKSRSVLQALKNTKHTITSRPIYLSSDNTYDPYTEESELAISNDYDISIQFLLQPHAIYDKKIAKKSIGIFNTETIPNKIPLAQLTSELLMDEIWTDSDKIKGALQKILNNYDCQTKVVCVPPTLDTNYLPKKISHSIKNQNNIKNKFIFYYIGDILDNKDGFKETCLAYLNTFTNNDDVILVVGLQNFYSDNNTNKVIESCRNDIKQFIPITKQASITVITPENKRTLTIPERTAIHNDGDCMIHPHYGVTINTNVLEGAIYKSSPIVNKGSASYQWLGEENLWGIDSYEDFCINNKPSSLYRFTSGELWNKPIINSLSNAMKKSYTNKFERDKKRVSNSKLRQYFKKVSYEKILNEERV